MKTTLTAFLILASLMTYAQGDWCASDNYNQDKYNALTPQEKAAYEANLSAIHSGSSPDRDNVAEFIIPTVVHIIHENGTENISFEQIEDAIRMLNDDYRRLNPDSIDTRDMFLPYVGAAKFQFRLAQIDPTGQATNGVVRIESSLTNTGDDNAKALSYWPTDKYFNIWVVKNISGGGAGGTILGYAEFPNWGMGSTYGTMIRSDRMGEIGTGTGDRTLTHEAGHNFGLYHTFQSGCGTSCASSGDQICDTPPVDQSSQGCGDQNTCTNDAGTGSPYSADGLDQTENFLSYNNCQNMFSKGQVERMWENVNGVAQLGGLSDPTNLIATGTADLFQARFYSNNPVLCAGGNVAISFRDWSSFGQTSWEWVFPGGNPATSTLENPVVEYDTPGLYDVALTVSNGVATKSVLKSGYVSVSSGIDNFLPVAESFETISSFPAPAYYPTSTDETFFRIDNTVGATGNASIKLANFNVDAGQIDELVCGSYDLSPMDAATLTFEGAYANNTNGGTDILRVYMSKDCGETWSLKKILTSTVLETSTAISAPFKPTASEWKEHSVAISSTYLNENFRFKFVFTSGGGNNLYIDDINIAGDFNPTPLLYQPINGDFNATTTTTIDWKAVDGVDTYFYEIDVTNQFNSNELIAGSTSFISASPFGEDTEFQNTDLTMNQKYYWRVKTQAGLTISDWSEIWNFTVSKKGVASGITEEKENKITIFPNPASGNVNMQNLKVNSIITIYNIMGQEVFTTKASNTAGTINLEGWTKGIYIVKAENLSYKLMVE